MNRVFLSAVLGIGLVGALFQSSSANVAVRAPEDYPLVCRGSDTFKTDSSATCEGCVNPSDAPRFVGFKFIRGSKPSGSGLAPGECSWVDRGMYSTEPDVVVQEIEAGGGGEKYAWTSDLHSPASYWIFNVHSWRGRLLASGAERNRKPVVSDKDRFPDGSVEVTSPDLYIAEVKVIDLPPPGKARLAVRVANQGTAEAGEVILDLRRLKVCKDHPTPRSYRQIVVPALKSGQEQWIYFEDFDRDWGTYITREGKNSSQLELAINPPDLYPDCFNVTPVTNYAKTERETTNNSLRFDPKAP